ncbi:hypothetical protein PHPALM_29105 [Phytophthora palmivora]|uniref:DOT1 domain-containing protein n=1 Tax=Phytophthora palmivora TaxID=4796 RepID=A0A2P4X8E8_9STRA|nr:hypothetical protein PHPALM_29105 [Phytophthora palmivora]
MVVVGSASVMGMNMKGFSMVELDTDVVPLDLKVGDLNTLVSGTKTPWMDEGISTIVFMTKTLKTMEMLRELETDYELINKGGNFYDIGSGCGKVAMAAALLHDFHKCCGIEVLDGLHAVALKVLDRWRYQMLDSLPATKIDVEVGFAKDDAVKRPDI